MADIHCPQCGKPNPEGADNCQYCQARLAPLPAVPPVESQAIHPGQAPVKKETAEFEKVRPRSENDEPIRPGEAPTKKKTAELEQALPAWLQALRVRKEGQEQAAPDTSEVNPPAEPDPAIEAEAQREFPDWLAGMGTESATDDDEAIPEWLASLSGKPTAETSAPVEKDKTRGDRMGEEWFSNQGEEKGETLAEAEAKTPPAGEVPDWLAGLHAESSVPLAGEPPETPTSEVNSTASGGTEPVPDWLKDIHFQPDTDRDVVANTASGIDFGTPSSSDARSSEVTPDWLTQLQASAAEMYEKETAEAAIVPTAVEKPEGNKPEPAEALPDWLKGIAVTAETSSGGTPALIDEKNAATKGKAGDAFSIETPDWLSTLTPEERIARPVESALQGETPREDLEPAELPSWVQAMRPVESVIGDVSSASEEPDQTTESQGPLAGLRGVLPAGAGLGLLRNPPAYSTKLRVDESQQRHAAHLEEMVNAENKHGQAIQPAQALSARILRWVISAVLILAVAIPIMTGMQVVPAASGYPPEMLAARNVIQDPTILLPNSPVLIAFDYEPALAGELEAAAAPLIDNLLFTGARLALVSTSPTGPALAENFLKTTQAEHLYQAGQQYINLGYLAGGATGVLNFVQNPPVAAPVLFEGQDAWNYPPLRDVRKLSDFALVIVLTDSADTGRMWIEQSGMYLEGTPMLMVISAQAEPLIRPFYDSKQIQGLVTGLAGGRAYEQAIQRPGLGQKYWDAFSMGLLAAEILIIVGGIWNAIAGLLARRKNPKQAEI